MTDTDIKDYAEHVAHVVGEPDIKALIERLRDRERFVMEGPAYLMRQCKEAADALEACQAEHVALQGDIEDLRALVSEYRDIRLPDWKDRAKKAEAALSDFRASTTAVRALKEKP